MSCKEHYGSEVFGNQWPGPLTLLGVHSLTTGVQDVIVSKKIRTDLIF